MTLWPPILSTLTSGRIRWSGAWSVARSSSSSVSDCVMSSLCNSDISSVAFSMGASGEVVLLPSMRGFPGSRGTRGNPPQLSASQFPVNLIRSDRVLDPVSAGCPPRSDPTAHERRSTSVPAIDPNPRQSSPDVVGPEKEGGKMRQRNGLKLGMVAVLAFSGLAVMPGTSWAITTLSTTVASASSTGPNTANTEVLSVANCSSKLVSGGGARVDVTSGTMPDGLKLDGTVPSTNGTGQSTNGATSPTYWIGAGGA